MDYQYTYGSGTWEDPWQIWSIDDLQGMRDYLWDGNAYFILMTNLDLSGIAWIPFGLDSDFVSMQIIYSHFDGNYKTISNMTIYPYVEDQTGWRDYIGLFGRLAGTVKRLFLKNFLIENGTNNISYVGGLVGFQAFNSLISECRVEGEINFVTYYGGWCIGILCGGSYGNIYDSSAVGSIKDLGDPSYISEVGGFCGWVFDGHVRNCYARVDVMGFMWVAGFTSEVGSHCVGSLLNCYSTGEVKIHPEDYYYNPETEALSIAGFAAVCDVGHTPNLIQNCFFDKETAVIWDPLYGNSPTKYAPDEHYGFPRTTAEMKTITTYTDSMYLAQYSSRCSSPILYAIPWDFEGVWGIDPAINDGYPYLLWEADFLFTGIPIAWIEDLYAIEATAVHTFAAGTEWEITTEGGNDKHYTQVQDLNLGGTIITESVIGVADFFTGTFDGNNYKILNYVVHPSKREYGLFFSCRGATLKNIHIVDAYMDLKNIGSTLTSLGITRFSFLVMWMYTDKEDYTPVHFENCTLSCEVNTQSLFYSDFVNFVSFGGLIFSLGNWEWNKPEINDFYITDCKVSMKYVMDNDTDTVYAGALLGEMATNNANVYISNCTVDAFDVWTRSYYGGVGGLIGWVDVTDSNLYISYCKVLNINMDQTNSNPNYQNFAYGYYLGGLIGFMRTFGAYVEIWECFAKGYINGTNTTAGFIGELLPFNSTATPITTVDIKNCYAFVDINCNDYSAGFATGWGRSDESKLFVKNCHSVGSLKAWLQTESDVAGFSLFHEDWFITLEVDHCYFNNDKITYNFPLFAGDKGIPKTTTEMRNINTFLPEWDFENIWGIHQFKNDGYPFLQVMPFYIWRWTDIERAAIQGQGLFRTITWQRWNELLETTDMLAAATGFPALSAGLYRTEEDKTLKADHFRELSNRLHDMTYGSVASALRNAQTDDKVLGWYFIHLETVLNLFE